ncbi:MAG TPA: TonB family protein [Longimicrobiaceae bacterium]|nr:TonB family protein [Longimicrobiaceae bacterium]
MFKVVVEHRKRRIWSARTVAISIGAHALVLVAVVVAAADAGPTPERVVDIDIGRVHEKAPQQEVKRTPPPEPNHAQVVKGRTLVLPTPTTVPTHIEPPRADDTPASPSDYSGEGPEGNVIGTPDPGPQPPPAADPQPLPDYRTDVIPGEYAEVQPQLASPREAQRLLERNYPPILRDAGVSGHTTVVLVIDKEGKVEPGSVEVRESTHDAFRDAAVRAAERFRFRPARVHGQPVAVVISIPIDWQIATP